MTPEPLTGLELRRKACGALGYYMSSPTEFSGEDSDEGWYKDERFVCHSSPDLPAIESDPGVSETLFLKWCEKHHFDFEMRRCLDKRWVRVHVYECGVRDDPDSEWIEGSTPSEARARAILAASARESR